MWEEILELAASKWGFLGLGAVLLISGGGRKVVRGAAKAAIKAGLDISDSTREFVAELKEQSNDLIAEVKAERAEQMEERLNESKPAAKASSEKKAKKVAE